MQLNLGTARVPRAVDGVSPSARNHHLAHRFVWKMVRRSLRRDAANHTPEACAPLFSTALFRLSQGRNLKKRGF